MLVNQPELSSLLQRLIKSRATSPRHPTPPQPNPLPLPITDPLPYATLTYQRPSPGLPYYRPAGIVMLLWSCFLMLIAIALLPLAALLIASAVDDFTLLAYFLCLSLMLPLAYRVLVCGIAVTHDAHSLLSHHAINVRPMLKKTIILEWSAYLTALASIPLILIDYPFAILTIILLATALSLTYTRILLRNIRHFHTTLAQTAPPIPLGIFALNLLKSPPTSQSQP